MFIGSCAGTFYAINKSTGELRWSYDIRKDGKQISFHGDPLVTDDLILIGTDHSCTPGGLGHVYAFEQATGKVRWKHASTGVPTDIVKLNSNVYFGTFKDQWSSLDLRTGELNWNFSIGTPNDDCILPRSPVTDGTQLFIAGLDGFIYSLSPSSGRINWKRKLSAVNSTSLLLHDKTLYVGTHDQRLYRLNAENGTVISELATEAKPFGRLTFANDSLVLFLEDTAKRLGYIVSIDPRLGGVRWQHKSSPEWASERPHLWKGLLVAGNCRGEMAAFRASDGAPQWKVNMKGCIRSIGSSGSMLFAGVQEGTIYSYEVP